MQIDFSQLLKDSDGLDIKLEKESSGLTLGEISKLAIKSVLQADQDMSHAEKLVWARLSVAITNAKTDLVNVESTQVGKLKDRIGKVFPSIEVAYAIENALEGLVN